MHYDYSKLKQKPLLDIIEMHFGHCQLDIMEGSEIVVINIGTDFMLTVSDGEVTYFGGLKKANTHRLNAVLSVMKKIQSIITIECPTFETKED